MSEIVDIGSGERTVAVTVERHDPHGPCGDDIDIAVAVHVTGGNMIGMLGGPGRIKSLRCAKRTVAVPDQDGDGIADAVRNGKIRDVVTVEIG